MSITFFKHLASVPVFIAWAGSLHAQDSSTELAKKRSNPIASPISVPFQFNRDHGHGPLDGDKATLNFQPVIPYR
ncbi:hypothetical protein EV132_102179 [Rhizobium sullae]|uniref:Uncharacterized protein n=1 Tax=Rhizobium sullae TaxID=50338 RepID=A0A4R3QC71_RHISU|nr:hypothetical protein EV132_102179 [Rhizobium sullae]